MTPQIIECQQTSFGLIVPVITWLLVIAGWIIVNHQNNKREKRKETRSKLDEIIEEINSIEELSVKYHCGKHQDTLADKIIRSLEKTRRKIKISALALSSASASEYIRFKQSITMNNFQSSEKKQLLNNDQLIIEILDASDILKDKLEKSFSEKYQ